MVARFHISGRDVSGTSTTYRGLYLSFHIKGPAALPMQYADNMMAFVITLFVCPAVVCDTQLKDNTKPVIVVTEYEGQMNLRLPEMRCALATQTANSNPILSCHGRKFTRNTPRMLRV